MKNLSQRGVALVVTLLMLSIITVTAVAFLALSRRERGSMSQTINLTDARDMNDTSVARAMTQIIAPVAATVNMLNAEFRTQRT